MQLHQSACDCYIFERSVLSVRCRPREQVLITTRHYQKSLEVHENREWRKGVFVRPFCHLVLRAARVDSPPPIKPQELAKTMATYRSELQLTQEALANRLQVSLKTIKNWENGRTEPNRR